MKIAVLAIALNEEQFVQRWIESAHPADVIILVDTGSTDNTAQIASDMGAEVFNISVKPWRFDVARNAAMALVPADVDVVVNLDLDEILMPGWREALEAVFEANPDTTRLHYDYIWSWNPDGSPGVRFYRDMIHVRQNYIWRHPCHETLYYTGAGEEKVITTDTIRVEHHPDNTKSRGQYLDLLSLAVTEDPTNDRMAHYYARELFFNRRWEAAIAAFHAHLVCKTAVWAEERSQSMIYLSQCYEMMENMQEAETWARNAAITCHWTREPLMRLATLAYYRRDWNRCLRMVEDALAITAQAKTYMNDPKAWGAYLYDIGYIAAFHLNKLDVAETLISKALEFEPDNARLVNNLAMLMQKQNDKN